jgi:hypothetical protein
MSQSVYTTHKAVISHEIEKRFGGQDIMRDDDSYIHTDALVLLVIGKALLAAKPGIWVLLSALSSSSLYIRRH